MQDVGGQVLHYQDSYCQHHQNHTIDVGESRMGEGEEVAKNDGSGKQQHRQQGGEILRLSTYPYSDDYPIDNQ